MVTKNKHEGLELFDTVSAHNKGTRVELIAAVGPKTGQGSGIFINVLGKDSDVCRDFQRKQINEWRKRAARSRKRGIDLDVDSAEALEEKAIELLTQLTLAAGPWENMPEPLSEFTEENIRTLYTQYPEIRRQVDEAASVGANF